MLLAEWLKAKGITRRAFAAKIKVVPSLITAYCDGSVSPSFAAVRRIIAATNGEVTADSFVGPQKSKRRGAA